MFKIVITIISLDNHHMTFIVLVTGHMIKLAYCSRYFTNNDLIFKLKVILMYLTY